MARPGWPERNRAVRSFRQLRRFHHVINSDKVFGTHSPQTEPHFTCQTPCGLDPGLRFRTPSRTRPFAKRSMVEMRVIPIETKNLETMAPPFQRNVLYLLVGAKP